MQAIDYEDGLYTLVETMRLLTCGRSKIYELGRADRLELVKFDGRVRVTRSSVHRLLREIKANRVVSEAPRGEAKEEEDNG